MEKTPPMLVLRLGTHAEKEYVEKLGRFVDALIVGANLMESTPGATSSLAIRFMGNKIPVYLDPMTYAYGTYVDPATGASRRDLDWIKSDQQISTTKDGKAGKGAAPGTAQRQTERRFKRSYEKLALQLGEIFARAIHHETAILPSDLSDAKSVDKTCAAVIDYQQHRFSEELKKDPELRELIQGQISPPQIIFAPYFYIDPTAAAEWTRVNIALASATARMEQDIPVHMVLCECVETLDDAERLAMLADAIVRTGVKGVWLWFSRFSEEGANTQRLRAFRDLVGRLSKTIDVYNMHGGFFSLALSKAGMRGISHGVGYGEQKDVVPIIGQSTPTVRYYVKAIRKRTGVPDVQRAFSELGIRTPDDFFREICDCAICRGIIEGGLERFADFGEQRLSTPRSKRLAQTPAAAKRCRFHFLLNRIVERNWVRDAPLEALTGALDAAYDKWRVALPIGREIGHVRNWSHVLKELLPPSLTMSR